MQQEADPSRSPVLPDAFHVRRSSSRLSGEDWKLSWLAEAGTSGLKLFITNTCKQTRECSGRATRVGPRAPREIADIRFSKPCFRNSVSKKRVSKSVNPRTISNYRSPIVIVCPIFRTLEQDYFRRFG